MTRLIMFVCFFVHFYFLIFHCRKSSSILKGNNNKKKKIQIARTEHKEKINRKKRTSEAILVTNENFEGILFLQRLLSCLSFFVYNIFF